MPQRDGSNGTAAISARTRYLQRQLMDVLVAQDTALETFVSCASGLRDLTSKGDETDVIARALIALRRVSGREPRRECSPVIARVLELLETSGSSGLRLRAADVARSLHRSPAELSRLLSRHLHCGFPRLRRAAAVKLAIRLLAGTDDSIKSAAIDAGFASTSQMDRAFAAILGASPREVRTQAREAFGRHGRNGPLPTSTPR